MLSNIKKMFSMLWKERREFYLFFLLLIFLQTAGTIASVLLPRYLIEFLAQGQPKRAVAFAGVTCVAYVLIEIACMITRYKKNRTLESFNVELIVHLAERAHSIRYEKYEDFKVREEYQFALKCANERSIEKIVEYILNVLSSVFSLIGLLYIISYVVWWLWLIIITSIVINTICEFYRLKYNFDSTRSQNAVEMCMLYARDRLTWKSFAKEVRLFSMYNYVVEKAEYFIDALSGIQKERSAKTFRALFWSYLFNCVQMAAVYGYVGYACFVGAFSVGEFALLTLSILSISQFTSNIAAGFMEVKQQGEYLRNCFDFLSFSKERSDGGFITSLKDFDRISFENVHFIYPNSENEVLKNVTYTFHATKKYGIVGANGSGKSTFIHLLMGLYDSTKGQIRLNGASIKGLDRKKYYSLFSTVLQDFNVFAYTVQENITFGMSIDDVKIQSLIDKIGMKGRIETTPQGTDTYITTEYDRNGTEFSGGEQQKLAIMRAFYKDCPILVLDEPTSALSPKSEYELYSNINELAASKTVFFISHRMASCRMCDEILVFDNGTIVETGSHEELMKKKGLYYQMFLAQADLYAEDNYEKN